MGKTAAAWWACSEWACLRDDRCLVILDNVEAVRAVAWSPNSEILASGSTDETIRLWDGKTGERLKTLRAERPYEGMNITGVMGITEAQKLALCALGAFAENLPHRTRLA